MKKLLVIFIFIFFAFLANAQVQFGFKAGLNIADINAKFGGEPADFTSRTGLHAGIIADLPLSRSFFIQPGLLFSGKGAKQEYSAFTGEDTTSFNVKYKINYLDLSIHAAYKVNVGSSSIVLSAGPVFSYALNGKLSSEATTGGVSESSDDDIEFGNENGQIKRVDVGIGFGFGVLFNRFLVAANYTIGISNLYSGGDDNNYFKNNVLGVSLGFMLGGK